MGVEGVRRGDKVMMRNNNRIDEWYEEPICEIVFCT